MNKNILAIAYELRKNTKNIYLQDFIDQYIANFSDNSNNRQNHITFELLKFHRCLYYIQKEKFDVSGWGLWEIPHQDIFCFYNKKENRNFDLVYNWFNNYEVRPSYITNSNNELAESIEEAIQLYEN